MNSNPYATENIGRMTAIISGKGGSGKTLIATSIARILTANEMTSLLVDADLGTAGLSCFLGLRYVDNVSYGLAELLQGNENAVDDKTFVGRAIRGTHGIYSGNDEQPILGKFVGAGNVRKLRRTVSPSEIPDAMQMILRTLCRFEFNHVLVDCRGGMDSESLAVCKVADDIILVLEPDSTSFQAGQHLVEILNDAGVSEKLRGFIINKVLDDPTPIVVHGSAVFQCQFLGAIPLDFGVARSFLVGRIPNNRSVFATHLWAALVKCGYLQQRPIERVWEFAEFGQLGFNDVEGRVGGYTSLLVLAYAWFAYFFGMYLAKQPFSIWLIVAISTLCCAMSSFYGTRRWLGAVVVRLNKKLFRVAKMVRSIIRKTGEGKKETARRD